MEQVFFRQILQRRPFLLHLKNCLSSADGQCALLCCSCWRWICDRATIFRCCLLYFFCFQPLYVFLSDPLSSSVLGLLFLSASDSCFAASQRAAHLGVIPLPVTVESEESGLLSLLNMWQSWWTLLSWIMAGQPTPQKKALLTAYWPLVSLDKALLNPYWGYVRGGSRLTSHNVILEWKHKKHQKTT